MPARLTPIEPPTPTALITGDPRRAFALAGELMVQPKMSHQARGLWGYTGVTGAGMPLTVQSTGIGPASAAAVLGDLALLGVKRLVRLGTCIAPPELHAPGAELVVESAIGLDGVSLSLGPANGRTRPDPELLHLISGVAPPAIVSGHDLPGRLDPLGRAPAEGASIRDLQTAATFAICANLGIEAAAVLLVTGDGDEPGLPETVVNEHLTAVGRRVLERLEKP